jgi:hypothetical protein
MEIEMYTEFLWRTPKGKGPLGKPRLRWEIILRWIFRKLVLGHGMEYSESG